MSAGGVRRIVRDSERARVIGGLWIGAQDDMCSPREASRNAAMRTERDAQVGVDSRSGMRSARSARVGILEENRSIAEEWRQVVVSDREWRRANSQGDGAVGDTAGFFVVSPGLRRRAFLKPGIKLPDADAKRRAAREKIAADLAHDLGLPVPPATLWRRRAITAAEDESVVISLVLFASWHRWAAVANADADVLRPNPFPRREKLAAASAMIAFDTWLEHDEHGDHRPNNLLWSYNHLSVEESQIVFLDYETALGADGSWRDGGWREVREARSPALVRSNLDADILDRAITAIQSLDAARIEEIVGRIPDDFLPANQRDMIVAGLLGRRPLLDSIRRAR